MESNKECANCVGPSQSVGVPSPLSLPLVVVYNPIRRTRLCPSWHRPNSMSSINIIPIIFMVVNLLSSPRSVKHPSMSSPLISNVSLPFENYIFLLLASLPSRMRENHPESGRFGWLYRYIAHTLCQHHPPNHNIELAQWNLTIMLVHGWLNAKHNSGSVCVCVWVYAYSRDGKIGKI